MDQLTAGEAWFVDVASLPPVAAQAVLDELIMTMWQAKANGTIPHHLPLHLRTQLHRLPQGQWLLDTWPLAQAQIVAVPFPSWLIADEGLAVVEAWTARQ